MPETAGLCCWAKRGAVRQSLFRNSISGLERPLRFIESGVCVALALVSFLPAARGQDDPAAQGARIVVEPPSGLVAKDHPNDDGTAVDLKWSLSPDDTRRRGSRRVRAYEVYRTRLADGGPAHPDDGRREKLPRVAAGVGEYTDRTCERGRAYLYEVEAIGPGGSRSAPLRLDQPVRPVLQWFDGSRAWFGVILLAVSGCVIVFTELVKSGHHLYVREIAGLKAIEEAVGRATEMGRPCLFVPGLQDMNEVPTVAGITLLGKVARIAAEYDATIEVPTSRSLVMTAARETVRAAYLAAGRPESYSDDRIYYISEEQFAYVAYLTGYMVRERPAACFYAGTFFAESLILAETGNSVGAIQIAGTAEASQLPFFVAACDYTLIGEELFAASAYLSGEPHQLGSLKGQDAGKVLAGLLLLAGCAAATLVVLFPDWAAPQAALGFLKQTLLGKGLAG